MNELLALRAERATGTNLGDLVDEAIGRILDRIEADDPQGAKDEGVRAFAKWRQHKAAAEWQEIERREAEKAAGMKLARETERAAFLAGDAVAVADWIGTRLAIEADLAEVPPPMLLTAYAEWWERGRDMGLNLDLEVAVRLAQSVLRRPALSSEHQAGWNYNLGNALSVLGRREAGTARLTQAISAYRAVLETWTRDLRLRNWAATQDSIGNTLLELGSREAGTTRLDEAVRAYREASEGWKRDRQPFGWASTQNNLGNALRVLGAREAGRRDSRRRWLHVGRMDSPTCAARVGDGTEQPR